MKNVRIAATGHTLTVIENNEFIATFPVKSGVRKRVWNFLDRHRLKADAISQQMFPWLKRNHRRK